MSAIIMSLVLALVPSHAAPRSEPRIALREATKELEVTRAHWNAAVAGDHPVAAGKWARRHFEAMQKVKAARQLALVERDRASLVRR